MFSFRSLQSDASLVAEEKYSEYVVSLPDQNGSSTELIRSFA